MLYQSFQLKEPIHLLKKLTVSFNHGNLSLGISAFVVGVSSHQRKSLITLIGKTCGV